MSLKTLKYVFRIFQCVEEIEPMEVIQAVLRIVDFLLPLPSIVLQQPGSEVGVWNSTEGEECEDNAGPLVEVFGN